MLRLLRRRSLRLGGVEASYVTLRLLSVRRNSPSIVAALEVSLMHNRHIEAVETTIKPPKERLSVSYNDQASEET